MNYDKWGINKKIFISLEMEPSVCLWVCVLFAFQYVTSNHFEH